MGWVVFVTRQSTGADFRIPRVFATLLEAHAVALQLQRGETDPDVWYGVTPA